MSYPARVEGLVNMLYSFRAVIYRSSCFCSSMWWGAQEYVTYAVSACLARLTWIVFVVGGGWPYTFYFVGCCLQDLLNIAWNILVQLLSSFFSIRLLSVHVVHPYSSIDTTTARKKLRFILSFRSDLRMIDGRSIAVHAFVRSVNLSTSFRELEFSVEISPLWLKHVNSVLSALTCRPMPAAARSKLCSRVSAWAGVFVRSVVLPA